MPVGRKVCEYAKLCKPVQIRVILDLQVGAGDSHMEPVSQFLSGQFHAVQYRTRRTLTHGMQVNIQTLLIDLLQEVSKLLRGEGGRSQCFDIHIRRNHTGGMNLLGTVHEDLHGMDLQVLRVILTPHPLQLLKPLLCILRCIDHEAAVNIDRQLSHLIQLFQALVNLLMELRRSRNTGVKYRTHAVFL